jgi:anti-anti-sigma factor
MADETTALPAAPLPELRITVSTSNDGVVVLTGELDLATAPQLADALATVSGAVDIDCRGLTFIDAAGIAVLVRASKRTTSIRLYQPTHMTRKVITVLGLDSVFFNGDDPQPSALPTAQVGAGRATPTHHELLATTSEDAVALQPCRVA